MSTFVPFTVIAECNGICWLGFFILKIQMIKTESSNTGYFIFIRESNIFSSLFQMFSFFINFPTAKQGGKRTLF